MSDSWNPDLYHHFRTERSRPFQDLLALMHPLSAPNSPNSPNSPTAQTRLLDLGCGSGELTVQAREVLGAHEALGIDASANMLARADQLDAPGVRFALGDLVAPPLPDGPTNDPTADGSPGWDAIIANASLHWVPNHPQVLFTWRRGLRPGGQLAVQVPANPDHPSHTTIGEVLAEEPFASALGGSAPPDPLLSVLSPERYAEELWLLGATEQTVRLQVYGMEMASWSEVVEWTSGTALVRVRRVLSEDLYSQFVDRYRERLGEHLQHRSPYFYAFKRIVMWARFP